MRDECQLEGMLFADLEVRLLRAEERGEDHRLSFTLRIAESDTEPPCLCGRHRIRKLPRLGEYTQRATFRLHQASRDGTDIIRDEETFCGQAMAIPHERLKQLDYLGYRGSGRSGESHRPHPSLLGCNLVTQLSM